jgi:hypothetical protein
MDRLHQLSNLISRGEYRIDAGRVADAMLARHHTVHQPAARLPQRHAASSAAPRTLARAA